MNFYADKVDQIELLNFIFNETDWQLYDLYSEYDQALQQYMTIEEVLPQMEKAVRSSYFNICTAIGRGSDREAHRAKPKYRSHISFLVSRLGINTTLLGQRVERRINILYHTAQ